MSENGIKFEILLEDILAQIGYQNLMRNITYVRRSDNAMRQVDIQYDKVVEGQIKRVMVEAKYTTRPKFYNTLWEETSKADLNYTFKTNLEEINDRFDFAGADIKYLITNKIFDKKIHQNKGDIILVEQPEIESACREIYSFAGPIEDLVERVEIRKNTRRQHRIYI